MGGLGYKEEIRSYATSAAMSWTRHDQCSLQMVDQAPTRQLLNISNQRQPLPANNNDKMSQNAKHNLCKEMEPDSRDSRKQLSHPLLDKAFQNVLVRG